MKTFVVGDLHGKVELAEKMIKVASDETQVVFLGDYLDSYDRTSLDCVNTIMVVLEAIRSEQNVIGLLGNHELSYLMPGMQCSGFSSVTGAHLMHLTRAINRHFVEFHRVGKNTLITHAGVTAKWDEASIGDEGEELKTIEMVLSNPDMRYAIGYSRGGGSPYGGIFWCDWRDEFVSFEHVSQVVGHTRTSSFSKGGIQERDGDFNIDCLETSIQENQQVLLIHEDESKEIVNIHDL